MYSGQVFLTHSVDGQSRRIQR